MDYSAAAAMATRARSAYKAGFMSGKNVGVRVDAMRWDALFHYAEFRDSQVGRRYAADLSAAKQGFLEGFTAAQNRKRLSSHHPYTLTLAAYGTAIPKQR